MRLVIDPDRCQGHSRCYTIIPSLVSIDDYGLASVVGSGDIPADMADAARLAVDNCPEFAIEIVDE